MYSYTPRLYISLINIYAIKIEYTFKIEREREREKGHIYKKYVKNLIRKILYIVILFKYNNNNIE